MKEFNELSLLEEFSPNEIKNEVFSSELLFSKFYQRNKDDELRELKIHIENAKDTGLSIVGGEVSVNALSKLNSETISILAGKNKLYFFKLYISKESQKLICFILIKRRKRTEEETLSLVRKLGIKNLSLK
ncbi:hypothetical protein RBA69_03690 [Brenneria goodwinii]|uniref:Uncharacterized protein n=1 Tax=Lonsdalea iberica TaxID=1082703 RepID=A0A1X3RHH7_9GAMM|nr:hypothetical protein [Lonsdalea iberica]OSN01252.1 hypothetical protein AU511_16650 [Lonsdalea iberica]